MRHIAMRMPGLPARKRFSRLLAIYGAALLLAGCEAMAITAFGIGAATGVAHTLNGHVYRTFTVPLPEVRQATLAALNRMGIKVVSHKRGGSGETITARAAEREIEINLEVLSPGSTRMHSVTKQGLLYDSATSLEIVLQTEKRLFNS